MFTTILAATLLSAPPDTAPVAEAPRYFFILYAGQSVPFRARTAHTWATGVKTVGGVVVETITVSWLPADANVQPLRLRPVRARTGRFEDTLAIMASHNGHISVWGPYEVGAARWEKAQEHLNYLESGDVRYRAIDSFNLNQEIINCVHAVTYAHPVLQRRIQPVIRVGEPGHEPPGGHVPSRRVLAGLPRDARLDPHGDRCGPISESESPHPR